MTESPEDRSLSPEAAAARSTKRADRVPLIGRLRTWRYAVDRWAYRRGLRDVRKLTLPRFLGIGAPKAASTWLHEQLGAHPDVFVPDGKEVCYFDQRLRMPVWWYAAHFADAGERLPGEVTPTYLAMPSECIRIVADLLHDVQLIVFLRDPIERAWSQLLMDLQLFEKRSLEDVPNAELERRIRQPKYTKHGAYGRSLTRWFDIFPRERFLIADFDAVRTDPVTLLRSCFAHIGVRTDVTLATDPVARVNAARRSREIPPHIRGMLREIHGPELGVTRRVLGDFVPPTWGE